MKRLWYQTKMIDMLPYLTELLQKNNVKYWLDWGSLLGAVRNRKMIAWDFDIDLGIFADDVAKVLALRTEVWKDGYDIMPCPVLESKLYFYKKDDHGEAFHIDMDFWLKDGDVYRSNFNPEIIHTAEELDALEEIFFEGRAYPCPKNPVDVLERFFGKDWATPKMSVGNYFYIKKYAPDNEDIKNLIAELEICKSAWDEAF